MGARRQGRILAFQTLFRYDLSRVTLPELLDFSWAATGKKDDVAGDVKDFARLLVTGSYEKLPEIDQMIKDHLQNWDFDRISRVDCAILRMSIFCLLYQQDIPESVTIDEAINIAKEFGSDDSYKFVNGILDAILKKHKPR